MNLGSLHCRYGFVNINGNMRLVLGGVLNGESVTYTQPDRTLVLRNNGSSTSTLTLYSGTSPSKGSYIIKDDDDNVLGWGFIADTSLDISTHDYVYTDVQSNADNGGTCLASIPAGTWEIVSWDNLSGKQLKSGFISSAGLTVVPSSWPDGCTSIAYCFKNTGISNIPSWSNLTSCTDVREVIAGTTINDLKIDSMLTGLVNVTNSGKLLNNVKINKDMWSEDSKFTSLYKVLLANNTSTTPKTFGADGNCVKYNFLLDGGSREYVIPKAMLGIPAAWGGLQDYAVANTYVDLGTVSDTNPTCDSYKFSLANCVGILDLPYSYKIGNVSSSYSRTCSNQQWFYSSVYNVIVNKGTSLKWTEPAHIYAKKGNFYWYDESTEESPVELPEGDYHVEMHTYINKNFSGEGTLPTFDDDGKLVSLGDYEEIFAQGRTEGFSWDFTVGSPPSDYESFWDSDVMSITQDSDAAANAIFKWDTLKNGENVNWSVKETRFWSYKYNESTSAYEGYDSGYTNPIAAPTFELSFQDDKFEDGMYRIDIRSYSKNSDGSYYPSGTGNVQQLYITKKTYTYTIKVTRHGTDYGMACAGIYLNGEMITSNSVLVGGRCDSTSMTDAQITGVLNGQQTGFWALSVEFDVKTCKKITSFGYKSPTYYQPASVVDVVITRSDGVELYNTTDISISQDSLLTFTI